MSVTTPSDTQSQVMQKLRQLRSRIRRYVLIEGTATVLVWLGVACWLSLGLDYLLELPYFIRLLIAGGAVVLVVSGLAWWVLLRTFREYRLQALALILERRFPRLNDRLITLVESFDDRSEHPELTRSMLRRTSDELSDLLPSLELREVFNRRPLWRSMVLSVLLLVSLGSFAWGCEDVFRTWFNRNLLLADEYYKRETDLTVSILAQPGERRISFAPDPKRPGEFLPYRHPRGADLTFVADVPEGKKVPEQVRFTYNLVNRSGGGKEYMTRLGERQFRYTLPGIHDNLQLWLKGGDYSSRTPFQIEVVDPPRLEEVAVDCLYPEYTRLNRLDESGKKVVRDHRPIQGTQMSLPMGTDFILQARSNKPLRSVKIAAEHFELLLTPGKSVFRLRTATPSPQDAPPREIPVVGPQLSADLRQFSIPGVMDLKDQPEIMNEKGEPHLPLRLPPNALLQITLHDEDDVISADPTRLVLNAVNDEPPVSETALHGIGPSITHQATIPIRGTITDDYGVADARFEYRLEAKEALEVRPFRAKPDFALKFKVQERFEVLPLDLKIGSKLTLSVVSTDADNLTGPHQTQGERYTFTIVSDDELRSMIAAREINLRHRFEQILGELQTARKDVQLYRTRYEEVLQLRNGSKENGTTPGPAPALTDDQRKQLLALEEQVNTAIARALGVTAKNANETASLEQAFRDIRDELENNALPDVKRLLDRLDNGIIKPLHSVNTLDFNQTEGALKLLKQALDGGKNVPLQRFDNASDELDRTITHMQSILAQMLKLESFNEVVQMLRELIKNQEELSQKVKDERKKKLIEGLK